MPKFFSAAEQILEITRQNLPTRQITAALLLFVLLIPIAAPLPAWAYNLRLDQPVDDRLHLTASSSTSSMSSTNFLNNLLGNFGAFVSPAKKNEKETEKEYSKETLEKKVRDFETQIPDKKEIKTGQILSLGAIPVDKNNNPVNGLGLQWKSSNPEIIKIINDSQAIALNEGEAKLIVSSEKLRKEISVTVLDKLISNADLNTNQESQTTASLPPPPDDPPTEPLLTEQQVEVLVSPENNLGSPIGQTEMGSLSPASATRIRERAGSANYSFSIPVASLPGRGVNASIGITYNSRVWSKSEYDQTRIFDFNIDKNWLAPGFELGYGSLEAYNTAYGNGVGYLLTAPDGTRHQLIYKQTIGYCATYESADGAFLQTTVCGIFAAPQITVRYPDGTQVTYGAITSQGKRFPINFTDRNGNMVSIAYLAGDYVGKIAYIRDTLNRYITFHYDDTAEKKLVAVTVPGYNNSSTPRQTIRFYYETLDLQPENRFEGPNVIVNAPDTVKVLKYVYFPGTQSGYRYDYSPYFGMIYKIWQLRGMTVSADNLNQTGTVTSEGNWAASTHYNYPAIALELPPPLTEVPKYSWRKDDWQGRITAIPQTTFNTEEQVTINSSGLRVGTRTTTITNPDGTKNVSVSNINQSEWDDGLLKETRLVTIENNQERTWLKNKLYWIQGNNLPQGRDNPRLSKIEVTNDAGQTRATSFEYDGYNNQTVAREHDFAPENVLGTELKRIETEYETGSGFINKRLLRLPKKITSVVNNATVVSKVVYEYDGTPLVTYGTASITQHDPNYTIGTQEEEHCYDVCPADCHGGGNGNNFSPCSCPLEPVCQTIEVPTNYRGNITKVTAFANPNLESDPNSLVTTAKYDVTGNMVESGVNCCNLKTWSYTSANHYAYPMSETSGDAGQLSMSATYDLNTGLIKTTTDENLQNVSFTYNPNNLQLIRTDSPNGAWQTIEYNTTSYPYFIKSTSSLDTSRSVSSWSFYDGRGQSFRDRSQSVDGYLSNDVEFDVMGRYVKGYSPYTVSNLTDERPAGIKSSEIMQRDGLGRALQTKFTDNTIFSASYNGLVSVMTDQAGKSRRQILDTLGRMIRVDEPNSTGNLGDINSPVQPTFYEYDGNDNLTKVTQTGNGSTQERLFKFDSLSRLTHERQVEANATLNNDGVKDTSAGLWTAVYKYNNKGLLAEGVDARGVKTSYTYDGLNRVKTVAYTDEIGYKTPQITYNYDEARNDTNGNPYFNKGRLTTAQTAADTNQGTPETIHRYDYDKIGHVVNHTQLIGNQSYNLQYNYNLAGQLISEKYPSGKVINISVDNAGRLSTVSDAQRTYLSGTAFNNQGLLSQINFGNGTNEVFSYNDRFQVESQRLMKSAEVLQKYEYSYGQVNLADGTVDATKNNSQLGKIESFIGTQKQWSQRFAYDELGRLSEAREYKAGDNAQLTYKQKFDFDSFGNLYRKAANNPVPGQQNPLSYVPIEDADIDRAKNRLATGSVYDDAGQVITDNKFRQMNFAYDANGRQVKASKANTPDAWSVYDAIGNRVGIKIYNNWQYVVYDVFGLAVAEYGISAEGLGGVKYILQDRQGSVRAVTNNNGFVVARIDNQAFGEEIGLGVGSRDIEHGYSADKVTRQGYALTEDDQATGQKHTPWRKLETQGGRWTRPDPYKGSMIIGNPQSFNRYTYVENDPVNYIDPSGLCTFRINIVGGKNLDPKSRKAAEDEISRIFKQAGHNVIFGKTGTADAVFTMTLTNAPPTAGATSLGSTSAPNGVVSNSGATYLDRVEDSLANERQSGLRQLGRDATNYGRALGRVMAHETGHFLLQILNKDHTKEGLMRDQFTGQSDLFRQGSFYDKMFNFTKQQAEELTKKHCPQPQQPTAGGSGGGGGDIFTGGYGYAWWYYSMWEFLNWSNSIPVGTPTQVYL